jgi:hypothetical protein
MLVNTIYFTQRCRSFLQCVKPGDKKVLATAPKFLAFLVVQVHKRVSYDNSHYSQTHEGATTHQHDYYSAKLC